MVTDHERDQHGAQEAGWGSGRVGCGVDLRAEADGLQGAVGHVGSYSAKTERVHAPPEAVTMPGG